MKGKSADREKAGKMRKTGAEQGAQVSEKKAVSRQFTCDCEVIHEDVVRQVQANMPEGRSFYDLANLYKMFADGTRLKILWALSCNRMCVCDLAVLLGMTKSAVSHQLKLLRLGRLVRFEKEGKNVFYSLADAHVSGIFTLGFEHIRE